MLEATIPSDLGEITSLTHLFLGSNKLRGAIPSEVLSLPNLLQIDFSANSLTGSIPQIQSTQIQVMNFSHNRITGKLSEEMWYVDRL